MEIMTVNNRDDFAEWAIARAKSILAEEGSALATAARSGDEARMGEAANSLGQAIIDALLETFDGLVDDDG